MCQQVVMNLDFRAALKKYVYSFFFHLFCVTYLSKKFENHCCNFFQKWHFSHDWKKLRPKNLPFLLWSITKQFSFSLSLFSGPFNSCVIEILITKIRREKEGLLSSVRGKGKKKKKEKKKTKFWEEKEQGLFTYLLTAKSAEVAEAGQGRRHPEKNHFRSKTE